ncbi:MULTISPECIES: pyridoxal phosphate-dependent aminotransferase [unclassified Streptomyces]|uniref:pyridoxal phosphate-dependent aminotransferase n=1 Tax=unclassified Streptomyces TaxID=2593676 RepID=UPI002E12DA97|nr:pyridoxal phosphate-dependent aminotransferase [Streptomyces sp. NBC_01197]WSS47877.1 pyridoxal phosphate-dependent aminotransferase [Streptomyces sp. NBC_01180]
MTAVTFAPPSPNLALNQLVDRRRAQGDTLIHLAFGEARLPVLPQLAEQLAIGASRSAYGPVAGADSVRAAVAGYFARRGLPTEADRIVVGPGSKPLLMAVQLAVPGDVLLPQPAWNTYAPQAAYAGKQVFGVPIPREYGGMPEPGALRETIRRARLTGGDPRLLVLTLPDNPTGTLAPPAAVREICAIARDEDLLTVSDEIYRDIVHDPRATPFLSPADVAPERTVVTTGLSKTLGLGGWRIGAARFPVGEAGELLRDSVAAAASELWSTLAGPMQQVAEYAFAEPPEIVARKRASARLHGAVARAVHRIAVDAGAECRPPVGGFYVYPDFEPLRDRLTAHGITDSASLATRLLDDSGIVVLGGHLLGDRPHALRFKAATSLLYGDERQQHEALLADDPASLPHIAAALSTIAEGFARLTRPPHRSSRRTPPDSTPKESR